MKSIYRLTKNDRYSRHWNYFDYLFFRYHKLFFGSLIKRGRKIWAFNFIVNLRFRLKLQEGIDPSLVLLVAWIKITPSLLLFPFKTGGVVHGVPLPISERKQYTFAIKWIIKLLRDKFRRVTVVTVSDALLQAIRNQGLSIEKRRSVYQAGLANRHLVRFFK